MISEYCKIVPIAAPIDLNATSPVACDSINMKNFHAATLVFLMGTLGGASSVLTILSGATNGAQTSALTFNYAWGAAAQTVANCDVLNAWTSAASVTITHGTYSNYMLVCEVDAKSMDLANNEEWLTAIFTDPTGATGLVNGIAILESRYSGGQSVTALS
jgi:hypothetical protein